MEDNNMHEKILEAAIHIFNEKGLKFTMNDIAAKLGISKKTIYAIIKDKESLFYEMVDYCFDGIKECERRVLNDESIDIIEKIRKILGVMPESYKDINFEQLYILKGKYPKIYKKVEERLESGWETTVYLIELGIKEGKIRPVNITLFKTMMEATLEQFFQRDILIANNISYNDALKEVVDILINGITI